MKAFVTSTLALALTVWMCVCAIAQELVWRCGSVATPEEVACFFTYLASDHASFFTGAILSMDGGFIAH